MVKDRTSIQSSKKTVSTKFQFNMDLSKSRSLLQWGENFHRKFQLHHVSCFQDYWQVQMYTSCNVSGNSTESFKLVSQMEIW